MRGPRGQNRVGEARGAGTAGQERSRLGGGERPRTNTASTSVLKSLPAPGSEVASEVLHHGVPWGSPGAPLHPLMADQHLAQGPQLTHSLGVPPTPRAPLNTGCYATPLPCIFPLAREAKAPIV